MMTGNGDVIQLLTTTPGPKTDPALSPDGRKIVFTLGGIDAGSSSRLWVVSSDGTGHATHRMARTTTPFVVTRRLEDRVREHARRERRDLGDERGWNGQTNITNDPTDDDTPSWSPDGTRSSSVAIATGSERTEGDLLDDIGGDR